jgi:hypothetical protein
MTPERFVAKLEKLGYTPHNAHELLGIGRRTAFRYAGGDTEIPEVVIKLLDMYDRHGVPGDKKK